MIVSGKMRQDSQLKTLLLKLSFSIKVFMRFRERATYSEANLPDKDRRYIDDRLRVDATIIFSEVMQSFFQIITISLTVNSEWNSVLCCLRETKHAFCFPRMSFLTIPITNGISKGLVFQKAVINHWLHPIRCDEIHWRTECLELTFKQERCHEQFVRVMVELSWFKYACIEIKQNLMRFN